MIDNERLSRRVKARDLRLPWRESRIRHHCAWSDWQVLEEAGGVDVVDTEERGMALFLATCVCDEGVYENSFRVVEAPSRLAIAESILRDPYKWSDYLCRSYLWQEVRDRKLSASELLKRIDSSSVDGDSRYKFSLYEIKNIERV